jgi:hypothetical protein
MTQRVSQDIAASPEVVWELVSDITRIGDWSTECYRCEWDAGQVPGLGATFTGHNRFGDKEWSNQSTIVEWVRSERVAWEVRLTGRAAEKFGSDAVTRWGFIIEGTETGTRLSQVTDDMRPEELKVMGAKFLPEIPDRAQRNLETMEATLAAIAADCE